MYYKRAIVILNPDYHSWSAPIDFAAYANILKPRAWVAMAVAVAALLLGWLLIGLAGGQGAGVAFVQGISLLYRYNNAIIAKD